jgi:Tol biopolymer transport system component
MIVPSTGGTPKSIKMPVSRGEVGRIKWAPDGKSFLYSKIENGVANIWSAPIDGKTSPKKITNFQSDRIFAFDVSPDNRLAISRGIQVSDVVLIRNAR